MSLVSVGKAIPYCRVRLTGDDDRTLPHGRIGNIHISGDNVTRGYYGNSAADADALTPDGWVRTGDLGLVYEDHLYITGRAKEIIFVNGQNYYPHDLESIAQQADGLELGKVVAAGVHPPGEQVEQLVMFVLHRGDIKDFLPVAARVARLINEQVGLEVAEVVPVRHIPKTTSGKIQRHVLGRSYIDGEFNAELSELRALRDTECRLTSAASRSAIESRLIAICEAALDGKSMSVNDNFFDIGANSLKLIEIHESIDREYPGQVDINELFDYPTILELAAYLQTKLTAAG
jgi:iturin family lipopeptide synthetase A